jgi:hypothetical protein
LDRDRRRERVEILGVFRSIAEAWSSAWSAPGAPFSGLRDSRQLEEPKIRLGLP